jgi:hypothetical protein
VIPYCPQDFQRAIHESKKRFKVVKIGRRGGKTELLINEQIRQAVNNPGLHWICAPSYKQVKSISWTRLKALLKVDRDWKCNEQELSAHHPVIGTTLELKGTDNEDSLRGVGLKSVGLDEAASIKENVWPEIIRPMLADSRGPALFIGTPKGKNWFHDIYFKDDPDWQSWGYPTSVNKYIHPDEIAQAKKDMSERLFRQEFLAEFLDDETGVFKKIRQCVTGEFQGPILGRFYVLGIDLAKTQDFTVLTVIDSVTRHVVAFERFQDVSWTEQKLRIQALAHKYNNALCVIDATGVGDPIVEDLQHCGLSLYYDGDKPGFKFTNESKNRLIDNLAIAIESRLVTFPNIEVLVDELQRYEYQITTGGKIQYGAPDGRHDDAVTSLALSVWGIRNQMREAQVYQGQEEVFVDRVGRGIPVYEFDAPQQAGY